MNIKKFYDAISGDTNSNLPLDRTVSIDIIRREVEQGKLCSNCIDKENPVYGYGAYKPKIMFIGFEPSQYDQDIGIPFSDKIGKKIKGLLKYLAAKINMVNNVYYTNAIIHPNKSNVDSIARIKTCKERLLREIEIVNPKSIIFLGRKSAEAILDKPSSGVKKIGNRFYSVYITHSLMDLFYKRDEIKLEVKEDLDNFIEIYENDVREEQKWAT